MPIKYGYAILIGIGLGLVMGTKTYLPYLFWDETHLYDWEKHFLPHFLNNSLWGFLVPFVYFTFRRFPLRGKKNNGNRLKAFGMSVAVGSLHELSSWGIWVVLMLFIGRPIEENMDQYIIGYFPSALISRLVEFWIIYAVFSTLSYSRELRDKQVELARTETELTNARLTTLKRQMQPHFLFNTLNTISSLMEISIHDAQKMVSKLGILLRRALARNQKHWVSLREEVEMVRTYLDIEQTRFNDRLQVDYDIDPNILDTPVPALILQPLVENAIKHGFSNTPGNGQISLQARTDDHGKLWLEVRDDGQGSAQPATELFEKGIGLRNVYHRLQLMYPGSDRMELHTKPGAGFAVRLQLDLQPVTELQMAKN